MYNAKYVITGLVVFVGIVTAPLWLNLTSPAYEYPAVALPKGPGMETCVEPGEWMRAEHAVLLNTWRDEALREGKRVYVATDGRKWDISLQNTCLACHSNYAEFCDKCHTTNSVAPYCWDCHVQPQGNNS